MIRVFLSVLILVSIDVNANKILSKKRVYVERKTQMRLLSHPHYSRAVRSQIYETKSFGFEKNKNQFQISVPKNWVQKKRGTSKSQKNIIHIGPPKRTDIYIRAQLIPLYQEIHPYDYLSWALQNSGAIVNHESTKRTEYGNLPDFIVSQNKKELAIISRMMAFKDANRLFLIEASGVSPSQNDLIALENHSAMLSNSFRLIQPTKIRYAESMENILLKKPKFMRFLFPKSWVKKSLSTKSKHHDGILLENQRDGNIHGKLAVVLMPIKSKIETEGFEIKIAKSMGKDILLNSKSKEIIKDKILSDKTRIVQKKWKLNYKAQNWFIISTSIYKNNSTAIFLMLSPEENQSILSWATNRRAYEVALKEMYIR